MSIADFSALGARLDRAAPRTAVVAAAHDSHTLEAVFAAQRDGLISPILVGRKAEISMLARQLDHALDPGLIVDADGEEDCAQQAVAQMCIRDRAYTAMRPCCCGPTASRRWPKWS